jgi:poly-beta-hydroxyalkanoate depolymerase
MNKSSAIKAIKNGATLHINSIKQISHVCIGGGVDDIKKIRLSTAEQICRNLKFRAASNNVEIYGA